MNHFFALSLPESVRQYIAVHVAHRWQEAMGNNFAPEWYEPQDYHLTLKFLGDLEIVKQAALIAPATHIAEHTQPFDLTLASPGTFPGGRKLARVFWMGVAQNDSLSKLAESIIDESLKLLYLPREIRPYKPHITLARRRRYDSSRSDAEVDVDEHTFPAWQVDSFHLMETLPSDESANGPRIRYNIVRTFPFGKQH